MRYVLLALIWVLFPLFTFAQFQVGADITSADYPTFLNGFAFSGDGNRVAISAYIELTPYSNSKSLVQTFERSGSNWIQVGNTIFSPFPIDHFGSAISLSENGKRIAIGAPHPYNVFPQLSGYASIFEEQNGEWVQIGQNIIGPENNRTAGQTISMSADGKRVAIGIPATETGTVKVYEEVNNIWTQLGSDINGESNLDFFGTALSISSDGTHVIIGSSFNGEYHGHVRVLKYQNNDWQQIGVDIDGENEHDKFGQSVSISANGHRIAISARQDYIGTKGPGYVKVFEKSNNNWVPVGKVLYGQASNDAFGYQLALSADGNRLSCGAPFVDDNSFPVLNSVGQVNVFEESNGNWQQIAEAINGTNDTDRYGAVIGFSSDGNYVAIRDLSGENNQYRAKVFSFKGVHGLTYFDNNQNCSQEEEQDVGIGPITLSIEPGNYTIQTDEDGVWYIEELSAGGYSLTIDTSNYWGSTCPITQNFTISNPEALTEAPSFGLHSLTPCSAPDVSVYMPFMRPCFDMQKIVVQACNTNNATGILLEPSVVLSLDPLIGPEEFQIPYTDLGNNQYQFDLDTLYPNQCHSFWIESTISCDAELGQSLCMEAELFPLENCALDSSSTPFPPIVAPCTTNWDSSSLSVDGSCSIDSVQFMITNTGSGDMTCYSPITVYIDGELFLIDSVQLVSQVSTSFNFPAIGESWHLEVGQHPLHPGNSQPSATVENCNGSTLESQINLFALDDADPNIDIYCGIVSASYDPNDKTGYPKGLTEEHFIDPNRSIQYRIRFQNTGTDTAFTVVVRDTLDPNLDIYSVRPGVSSHAYSFTTYGQGILEWTFNDILLPDSIRNEPKSHGFLTFTVKQKVDLPEGTEIKNSAGIYFDFNDPIITNTTQHKITYRRTNPLIFGYDKPSPFLLYPNPNEGLFTLELLQTYPEAQFKIFDINGRLIQEETIYDANKHTINLEAPEGMYFIRIETSTGLSETFKVLKF